MRITIIPVLMLSALTASTGAYIYKIGQEWQRREGMDDSGTFYKECKQQ